MSNKLVASDEAYLCILCLRNSTERIIKLYLSYMKLRSLTGGVQPVLVGMLMVLHGKFSGLQEKLVRSWPEYTKEKKWHNIDEQMEKLTDLSEDTQQELQQICSTEAQLLQVVCSLMRAD